MSVDMDIHGYPWIWISMDIHRKSVDMDMDMDVKFHIHGNPGNSRTQRVMSYFAEQEAKLFRRHGVTPCIIRSSTEGRRCGLT